MRESFMADCNVERVSTTNIRRAKIARHVLGNLWERQNSVLKPR